MARRLTMYPHGPLVCDRGHRLLAGTVLPYGQPGRTSAGKITAAAGALGVAARVVGNLEHDRTRPVALMLTSEDTADGLRASFQVAPTTAGDDLLAEVEAGLRTGMSVEVEDPVIRGGALVGGTLVAVGFVTEPAFEDARVDMVASDTPEEDPEDDEEDPAADPGPVPGEADTDPAAAEEDDDDPEEDDPEPVTAGSGSALATASGGTGGARMGIRTVREFTERMSAAVTKGDNRLLAALADITQTGVGGDISQAQWLGELWSGIDYQRRFVPLLTSQALTSYTVQGWRWVTPPVVAAYAGDKAAIASNTVDTESTTSTASRLAGGHDLDRKFVDFGDSEFLASYLNALANSYARLSDGAALTFILANDTAVTPGLTPTGVSNGAGAVVDAALAVLHASDVMPDWAIVGDAVWRGLLLQDADSLLALLSQSLGLDSGSMAGFTLIPGGSSYPAGSVTAGVKRAGRFLELPGVPIRVDALNLANGGVDTALFGYYATMLDSAIGLRTVEVATASINAGADFALTVGAPDATVTTIATYPDGTTGDVTNAAVLTSGTPAKATIVAGKVHAVAAGTSVITSTYNGRTDTTTVTVS